MNWLKYVLQLVPMIPVFVQGIETISGHATAAGGAKPTGADKSQAVVQLAGAALGSIEEVAPQSAAVISAITPALQDLINGTVKMFNATGVFKTSAPNATAAHAGS